MQVGENYMYNLICFMKSISDLKLGYDMCELYAKFYMLVDMFRY